MNFDIDEFPEDRKRWQWKPWRWVVGLIFFWTFNLSFILFSDYNIIFIFLFLILYMVVGIITYREGYQSFFAYRMWIFLALVYAVLLYLGLEYILQKIIARYRITVSIERLKQVIALIAVTPFVLWALRMSKYFVQPVELENNLNESGSAH